MRSPFDCNCLPTPEFLHLNSTCTPPRHVSLLPQARQPLDNFYYVFYPSGSFPKGFMWAQGQSPFFIVSPSPTYSLFPLKPLRNNLILGWLVKMFTLCWAVLGFYSNVCLFIFPLCFCSQPPPPNGSHLILLNTGQTFIPLILEYRFWSPGPGFEFVYQRGLLNPHITK